MTELTKDGKPRQRKPGGGRPAKHGEQTRSIKVPLSIPTELVTSIPDLQVILDHWEEKCLENPDSTRHYFLRQALEEIRALGF
jgi:hypothetical protein